MPYVITQRCCNDASCIAECPVDCIRPTPADPGFTTAEMLHIDPDTCIDCGACADACPVDAIFSEDDLTASLTRYRDINASYFQEHPLEPDFSPVVVPTRPPAELGTLRVAIVGAGPAACYAALALLDRADVELEMFDKLPTPWGLVRAGVAPDHSGTKSVTDMFASAFACDRFACYLNVEVGKHVSHEELLAHHHAVIYAVGASADRRLDIPGEELPGSHSATEFVAWYNGHPDYADRTFDLSGERAVIVGNGNVALDVARVLSLGPDQLAATDIADHALAALRGSNIREVVVLGRRGPEHAAYTSPEFLALGHLPGVDVIVDDADIDRGDGLKVMLAREYAERPTTAGNKRIVLRYWTSPTAIVGSDSVEGVEVVHNEVGSTEMIATNLVIRSIGYRGRPIAGLPFDEDRAVVPNELGRVDDGVYVTGWIKRGPRGVIGSNRRDAEETVEQVIADFIAGKLAAPSGDRDSLAALIAERRPDVVDRAGWARIDKTERTAGKAAGRPRVKLSSVAELVAAASPGNPPHMIGAST